MTQNTDAGSPAAQQSRPILSHSEMRARYASFTRTCKELLPKNKTTLFEALAAEGITRVVVFFDGSGDEGQIESIEAKDGDDPREFPNHGIALDHALMDDSHQTKLTVLTESFSEAIARLAYAYLSEVQDGWENGEGAHGFFTFDVATRTVSLDFNERFIDTENSTYEF